MDRIEAMKHAARASQLVLLARSVAHTRPRQLFARLRLELKRRMAVRAARCFDLRARLAPPAPPRADRPLKPLLPRRTERVDHETTPPRALFCNAPRELAFPHEWFPSEWTSTWRLELIQLHSMEWLEALDDATFERAVCDWIGRVPPYGASYWRGGWNAFALSIRVVVWMQEAARRGRGVRLDVADRIAQSLAEQMRFLEANLELDVVGNHLLKNVKALAWAARFFEGAEAERWRALAEHHLARELDEQILSDGMHFERSPAYHAQVCADLIDCRLALHGRPIARVIEAKLALALRALADLTHPDGSPSLFNDGGLDMSYAPADLFECWRRLGGDRVHARPIVALDAAGYYAARAGKSYVLVDCGAIAPDFLPAHGHGDALSLEWSVAGERILVDAGVFEYVAGERREWSRSTRAHNTVTLDGRDQAEFWSSFRVGRRPRVRLRRWSPIEDGFVLEGEHDGFAHLAGAPIHRRLVRATPSDVRIHDRIEGGAGQRAQARFLLHPSCSAGVDADGVVTLRSGPALVRVVTSSPIAIEDARWFPDFGLEVATKQLVVDLGCAPCQGDVSLRALAPVAARVAVLATSSAKR